MKKYMPKVYKHISKPEHSVPAREVFGVADGVKVTCDMLENMLLSGGLTKKMNTTAGSLIVEENLWDEAMALARSGDDRLAFRASWGLEWAYTMMPEEIVARWGQFFEDFLASRNDSVHRVYSKMICDMMRRRAIALSADEASHLAEKCFDLLINPDTAIAVKVWQIEILHELSPRIGWIGEHLTETVRTLSESPDCTPAMAAHARHYFRKLKKCKMKN